MTNEEKITRIRALLASARSLRTLPVCDRPLTGLDDAVEAARIPAPHHDNIAPYPIRRRHLLSEVSHLSRHFALLEEVEAFNLRLGVDTVHGLSVEALEALCAWLRTCVDDQQCAADWRHAPPAR